MRRIIRGKKVLGVLSALFLIMAMVGCSSNEEGNKELDEKSSVEVENKDSDSHYPVTVTTYNQAKEPVEVTFKEEPKKVIAVYQNSIETLLALGLEEKIVAASGLDHDVKDEFKDQFEKLNYYENVPTKEEVIGLQPDFILSWYSLFNEKNLSDVDFWHERDINTYISRNSGVISPNTLENEYDDILNMGKIFNVEDKAEELVNDMKVEIEKAKEFVKGKEKVKALIIEVEKDGVYRVYGEDSIGGDIASQIGADLVVKENNTIGNEEIIKLNPDVIFSVYYGQEIGNVEAVNSITKNPALSSVSALENNRVHPIMLSEVYSSGIRTLDGIESISKGLYPDLHKEQ